MLMLVLARVDQEAFQLAAKTLLPSAAEIHIAGLTSGRTK